MTTVKPLEWSSEPPYSVARVSKLFLLYSTECVWNDGKFEFCQLSGNCVNKVFPTPEAARAAAQADYEARILSALSPSSIDLGGEVERLTRERDEARRKLFPYADATEISGMSWNGFYLIGDTKSIRELRRIENDAAQIEVYRKAFDEYKAATEARLATAEEALEQARNNENFWRIRAKIAEGKEQAEALASLQSAASPPNGDAP